MVDAVAQIVETVPTLIGASRNVPPQVCFRHHVFPLHLNAISISLQNTWLSAVVLYLANDVYNVMAVRHSHPCSWVSDLFDKFFLLRISGNGTAPSMIVKTISMRSKKECGQDSTVIPITNGQLSPFPLPSLPNRLFSVSLGIIGTVGIAMTSLEKFHDNVE